MLQPLFTQSPPCAYTMAKLFASQHANETMMMTTTTTTNTKDVEISQALLEEAIKSEDLDENNVQPQYQRWTALHQHLQQHSTQNRDIYPKIVRYLLCHIVVKNDSEKFGTDDHDRKTQLVQDILATCAAVVPLLVWQQALQVLQVLSERPTGKNTEARSKIRRDVVAADNVRITPVSTTTDASTDQDLLMKPRTTTATTRAGLDEEEAKALSFLNESSELPWSPTALETTLKALLRLLVPETTAASKSNGILDAIPVPFVLRVVQDEKVSTQPTSNVQNNQLSSNQLSNNQQQQQDALVIWVRSLLRLPRLVANACQRQKRGVPRVWWSNPLSSASSAAVEFSSSSSSLRTLEYRLLRQALAHALSRTGNTPDTASSLAQAYAAQFLVALIRQNGATHTVAQVLVQASRCNPKIGEEETTEDDATATTSSLPQQTLSGFLTNLVCRRALTPRETAVLWNACHQYDMATENWYKNHPEPPSMVLGRALLGASTAVQTAAVYQVLFNALSSFGIAQQEHVRCLIRVLLSLEPLSTSSALDWVESENSDSDEDDEARTTPTYPTVWTHGQRVLAQQTVQVARKWSSVTYVRHTDPALQVGAGKFLEWALPHLQQLPVSSEITLCIVDGVTPRLESSQSLIRQNGMRVAEALATVLGQDLSFDELREGESHQTNPAVASEEKEANNENSDKVQQVENDDDDGDDSIWDDRDDEDFQPYGLDDDEDDLRPTPRPTYLRDALDLLRTPESEDFARSHHETALLELPVLVRARPMDLVDVAPSLAMQVLRMENKFNLENFGDLVASCLVALTVAQPVSVAESLIAEIFRDGSLSDRLKALGALGQAAFELSGYKDQQKKFEALGATRRLLNNRPKTSGRRALVSESEASTVETGKNTRRWRKRTTVAMINNEFSRVAPMWFYGLLQSFIERREDTVLWGGAVGATLLSKFILTLAMIVELAGRGRATEIMAKDLFECVWGFRQAEVSEVRTASLCSVCVAIGNMQEDHLLMVLGDESISRSLKHVAYNDPEQECRQVATDIAQKIKNVVAAMGPLMIESI